MFLFCCVFILFFFFFFFFFFQAEDGIRDGRVTGVQTCALPILIAAALTAIAGSSDVLDRAFVTYSNAAKTELVGVPAALINEHGAVKIGRASCRERV